MIESSLFQSIVIRLSAFVTILGLSGYAPMMTGLVLSATLTAEDFPHPIFKLNWKLAVKPAFDNYNNGELTFYYIIWELMIGKFRRKQIDTFYNDI